MSKNNITCRRKEEEKSSMKLGFLACVALLFFHLVGFVTLSEGVLPRYIAAMQDGGQSCEELLNHYFNLGFSHYEFCSFLALAHGTYYSVRHIRRMLNRMGLYRRKQKSSVRDVVSAVSSELEGSASCIGYRLMLQRLRIDHHLIVDRETVRLALKVIDPDGVEMRKKRRLKRRKYSCPGPNYLWHIDGYDKLKPYGFAIHGCIDGYSRRIMWLEVTSTNKDAAVIADHFLQCVQQMKGTARIVRADPGTENVKVEVLQKFYRANGRDSFSGEKSFMYGKSTANQRIEAWWAFLRNSDMDWWITFFKDLRDSAQFKDYDAVHVECLRFCFMGVIQAELDRIAKHWNLHRIRPQNNVESPPGRPDTLFFLSELKVLSSSTVQTSGQSSSATSSAISSAISRATSAVVTSIPPPTPSPSQVQPISTSSASSPSPVQPTRSISAASSSSASPLTNVPQSTKQPTTSDLSAKAKTIGGLEIMGFVILTILAIIIIAFAIYYFFFRKQMYPENVNGQVPAEVGITHKGFVGDAESPTKVAAPEPEVKVPIGPEVTPPKVMGNEEPEDSAL